MKTLEERRAYSRAYYLANREKARAYQREYNLTHKSSRKGRSRKYSNRTVVKGNNFTYSDIMHAPTEKAIKILTAVVHREAMLRGA